MGNEDNNVYFEVGNMTLVGAATVNGVLKVTLCLQHGGQPLMWGFTPDEANEMASALEQWASYAERENRLAKKA